VRRKTTRPTSSKVKEALFNIIREYITKARFLDLYAGTGAIGIEALHQGASWVTFVDASRKNTDSIKKSIDKLRYSDRSEIVTKKVISFINSYKESEKIFDLIFLDPPYYSDELLESLKCLSKSALISEDTIIVAEHSSRLRLPDKIDNLLKKKDYIYGDTTLSVYVVEKIHEKKESHISRYI